MGLRGVYRILRLPLVVTPVADVLAGYTVALLPNLGKFEWDRAALLAGTSAGLYLFGMVQNDLVDAERDRLLGAPRPLVTGDVTRGTAAALLVLTGVLAAVCAVKLRGGALVLALATFAAINGYNLAAKHGPFFVAMLVMALCRFLNFGIGVTAAIGYPKFVGAELLLPTGPLWARQALALFCVTLVVTGYSICARHKEVVSTRPWKAAFLVTAVAGFGMIALSVILGAPGRFHPPVARVFAGLLLAGLWPGGLWSAAGHQRKADQYAPFIERALYWMVAMDIAFVLDGLLTR